MSRIQPPPKTTAPPEKAPNSGPRIVLYGRPFNRADRVQWTLEELGLDYEYRILDVFGLEHRKPELRAKYGLCRLPFIELDDEILFESGAIMIALAEEHRERASLLPPSGTRAYREVLQWLFFANSTLDAADETLESNAAPSPFAPLTDVLTFLSSAVSDASYIAGDAFSIADIALANNLKYVEGGISGYPALARYYERQTSRPAYARITSQAEYPRDRIPRADDKVD